MHVSTSIFTRRRAGLSTERLVNDGDEHPNHDDSLDDLKCIRPLPQPVILPQQRPRHRSRGFVRAYAPSLQQYKGIDQVAFLQFLDDFRKYSKANPVLRAVNTVAMGATFAPEPIAFGIAAAVNAVTYTSVIVHGRYRTNTYLEQANETIFHPKNLHCMIVTYKPDKKPEDVVEGKVVSSYSSSDSQSSTGNISSDREHQYPPSLATALSERSNKKKFRASDARSKTEWEIPESALLIYPQSDTESPRRSNGAVKRQHQAMRAYLDKHANTGYVKERGRNSKLAVEGAADRKADEVDTEPNRFNRMKRSMQEDVMYLMICELPRAEQ